MKTLQSIKEELETAQSRLSHAQNSVSRAMGLLFTAEDTFAYLKREIDQRNKKIELLEEETELLRAKLKEAKDDGTEFLKENEEAGLNVKNPETVKLLRIIETIENSSCDLFKAEEELIEDYKFYEKNPDPSFPMSHEHFRCQAHIAVHLQHIEAYLEEMDTLVKRNKELR